MFNTASSIAASANTSNQPTTGDREHRLRAQVKKQRQKAAKYANYLGQVLTRAERAEEEVETLRQQVAHLQRSLSIESKIERNEA